MVCICKRAFGQNALFLTFSPLLFTLSCLKIRLSLRLDNVKQMSSVSTFLLLILFVYVASRHSSSVYYHISAVYLISLLRKATLFCKCLSKKLPTMSLLFILNESISPSLFVLNSKAIATGCENHVCQKPQARDSVLNSKMFLKFTFLLLCINPAKYSSLRHPDINTCFVTNKSCLIIFDG